VVYVVIDLAFGLLGVIVGRFIVAVLPLLVWTVWASGFHGIGGETTGSRSCSGRRF